MILSTHKNQSYNVRYFPENYVPLNPKYFYQTDIPKKTEHTLYRPNNHKKDYGDFGIDFFIHNKEETIHSKIKLLYDEIKARYYLKNQNIYRINVDQCACNSLIFTMGEEFFDKTRIELERKILDLEQEKRREEASFFRDISFLNKELRDTLIEKLEENQKAALMLDQGEELPCNT